MREMSVYQEKPNDRTVLVLNNPTVAFGLLIQGNKSSLASANVCGSDAFVKGRMTMPVQLFGF